MPFVLFVVLTFCGGCLLTGCTFDAGKIAGFEQPGVDWQKGKRLKLSADFDGHATVKFHPDGSLAELDVDMRQKVSPVIEAQGLRAQALPAIYEIQGQVWAAQTAAWVGLIDSLTSKLISAAPGLMQQWAEIQATKKPRMDAEERGSALTPSPLPGGEGEQR